MEIKARKDWKQGKSVIKERSDGGQVIWRKSVGPRRERFLVRVGKDGCRQGNRDAA